MSDGCLLTVVLMLMGMKRASSVASAGPVRFSHSIPAPAALCRFMELITNVDTLNAFSRKLAPSLVTLSQSRQPEIQVGVFCRSCIAMGVA